MFAARNKTIRIDSVTSNDALKNRILHLNGEAELSTVINKTICGDAIEILDYIPDKSIDLIITDPPYNMTKKFNENMFNKTSEEEYKLWLYEWIPKLKRIMKPNGSLYICSEWQTSIFISEVCKQYFILRNRISWEREKGRGALNNWKNCSEDIYFFSNSDEYKFNSDRVKSRKVKKNKTNDFEFIDLEPTNIWTDITVPFWSMSENTEHPTQKPEKLIAKLVLASSDEEDIIFDPFLGSGTTSVVAEKLGRKYFGIEREFEYCLLAEYRLSKAKKNRAIQGFKEGVFYERNSI